MPSCIVAERDGKIDRSAMVVAGFRGEKISLFTKHPRECSTISKSGCKITGFVVGGDLVMSDAIGCDGWSYITAVNKVSRKGWVPWWRVRVGVGAYRPVQEELFFDLPKPDVCIAALEGRVDNAMIDNLTPYTLPPKSIMEIVGSSSMSYGTMALVQQGQIDLDNDGVSDRVGVVMDVGDSNFHIMWPLILNADGVPSASFQVNATIVERLGAAIDSLRVFRFRGITYVEVRKFNADTNEDDNVGTSAFLSHDVWRFSRNGATQICMYVPRIN